MATQDIHRVSLLIPVFKIKLSSYLQKSDISLSKISSSFCILSSKLFSVKRLSNKWKFNLNYLTATIDKLQQTKNVSFSSIHFLLSQFLLQLWPFNKNFPTFFPPDIQHVITEARRMFNFPESNKIDS